MLSNRHVVHWISYIYQLEGFIQYRLSECWQKFNIGATLAQPESSHPVEGLARGQLSHPSARFKSPSRQFKSPSRQFS